MSNPNQHFTRGRGLLEPWLAKMRAQRANRLIPAELRAGRILDIGCGSFPYFLSHTVCLPTNWDSGWTSSGTRST
jgi:hypothetical protein